MDDLMQGTWHVACWWERDDGEIMVVYLHHGHMFYFRADDHITMHKETLTQETIDRLMRLPRFKYENKTGRNNEVIERMNNMLGIKPEPKPEPVRVEVPEPISEASKPVTRVTPLERDDGQMRLF